MPTELKAHSTLQIESDLIISEVLTVHVAQLVTAVTVITKIPGSIPSDQLSIHLEMLGLGLQYKNSLPATRNILAVKLGRTWANARICLALIVASNHPKEVGP